MMRFLDVPNVEAGMADVVILPVPYEATVSFKRGTAQAPAAILKVSDQLEHYEEDGRWCPTLQLKLHVASPLDRKQGETEEAYHARLHDVTTCFPEDALLIALGGEHGITPSIVGGRMKEPGTIVHLDAHADLRSSYQGSVYSHACPMYRIRQMGHRILQIGIRSLDQAEAERIELDSGIECFLDAQLQRPGGWDAVLERLDGLTGPVWLSLDMDAFDPALVPGVGTPQPGGLNWYQVVEVFKIVLMHPKLDVRGVDIVELVPDRHRVGEMVAAKLVQKTMSFWGMMHRRPKGT